MKVQRNTKNKRLEWTFKTSNQRHIIIRIGAAEAGNESCKQTEWPTSQQNKLKTRHRSWLLFATTILWCMCVRLCTGSSRDRKRPTICACVCGDIVFYKLRSKSEMAIEHNITIYLMAKYCQIYHLYYMLRECLDQRTQLTPHRIKAERLNLKSTKNPKSWLKCSLDPEHTFCTA